MFERYKVVVRTTLVVIGVLAGGTAGYIVIEGMSAFDALYMTTITVTTIGFREVQPLSSAGKLFTIVIAFVGIGVILFVATEAARLVLEGKIRKFFGINWGAKMIKRLSDHIVVCGYGRTGRAVVEVLSARRVPFVVVELDRESCLELEEKNIPFVRGDVTQKKIQQAARVEKAKTFLACLAEDAHNVFAILLARQLNSELTIIARAVEEGSEDRLRMAGADKVINPYRLGGMRLALTALNPTVADFIDTSLPGSNMELELSEVEVASGSELAGKTLAGAEVRKRFGVIVVAIKRTEDGTFNPGPDEEIRPGDVLVTLGPIKEQEKLQKALQA